MTTGVNLKAFVLKINTLAVLINIEHMLVHMTAMMIDIAAHTEAPTTP